MMEDMPFPDAPEEPSKQEASSRDGLELLPSCIGNSTHGFSMV